MVARGVWLPPPRVLTPGGYRQVGLDTDEMQREVESCKYTALVNAQVQKAGNRRDRRPDLCAE